MNLLKESLVCLIALAGGYAAAAPTAEDLGVVMAPPGPANAAPATVKTPPPAAKAPDAAPSCPPEDALFLPTGFGFSALLQDAVYSFATAAPTMALIENDVRFRDKIVFPRGTRLVGNVSAMHTVDRINILWSLAVLPEGCEFPISAIALSADDGSAGIRGRVESHESSVAVQIALKSMLGAANVAAQAASTVAPIEGAVASGFSSEASQNLDQGITKTKSLESIYVHERTGIRVFVLRRFVRSERRQP